MRTPLLLALVSLALAAPTAVALGLPAVSLGLRADDAAVSAATPETLEVPAIADASAVAAEAASLAPALAPAPALERPLAPFAPGPSPATAMAAPASPPPAPPAAVQAAAATGLLWLVIERLGLGRAAVGAFALLYSRLAPSELLDHARRERVVELVRARPGIGPSEIGQAMGMNWGVLSYHLDRLERAGLITSQRVGQHRCFFVPGAVPRDAQEKVGLFRADTTRRVAQLVRERPGIAQRELAAALGLSASATSKQVSRLEAAALVRRETGGDGLRLYPQAGLDVALPA